MGNKRTIYSGKFDIDKLIFYHEKESHMGHLSENAEREAFHFKAVRLLKELKELQGDN